MFDILSPVISFNAKTFLNDEPLLSLQCMAKINSSIFRDLRSCGTLQQAIELIQQQRPHPEESKDPDSISQASTIQ